MFAQIIELVNSGKTPEDDVKELIDYFICGLEHNGQILSKHFLMQTDNGYKLYVTTPKSDSLNDRFDSIYVKRDREKLGKHFTINVVQLGAAVGSPEYCSCKTRTAMEMQTFDCDIDSVFTCCTCGKPIALYELPYVFKEQDHYWVVNWQNSFRAVHTLWLDSLSDRFTGNQLSKANSALNKIGREIANEIAEKTATKVYYNIFDDLTKKVKFVKIDEKFVRLCPCCERPMNYVKFCEDYEGFVCEDCSLSSDLPKD